MKKTWTKLITEICIEHKGRLFLSIILLSISGFFEATSILGLTPIVDILFNSNFENASAPTTKILEIFKMINITPSLASIISVFLILVVLKNIVAFISKIYLVQTEFKILGEFIGKVLHSVLYSSWKFFSDNKSGELGNTFVKETDKVKDTFQTASFILANLVRMSFYFILAVSLSYEVTFITMGLLAIALIPFSYIGKINYRHNKIAIEASNSLYSAYEETFTQTKTILSYANQKQSIKSVTENLSTYITMLIKTSALNLATPIVFEPIGYAIVLFSIFIGHSYFTIPAAELLVILYSIRTISTLAVQTVGLKNKLQQLSPSLEQINRLEQMAIGLTPKDGKNNFEKLEESINLKNVSFSYDGQINVLDNISLSIPKGKFIAFTGESGSGKTTLIDLFLKLHTPKEGSMSVDGISLTDIKTDSWRNKIGYVSQEPVLFNGSIADNLRWANPNATEDDINNALELANASSFVSKLKDSVNTQVKDRGARLSGGQRQRISLAMALIRNPDIIILDEATSALDSQSEAAIQTSIDNLAGTKTIISIAHRLSTIKLADTIHFMHEGKILDSGTFDELSNRGEGFSDLVKKQNLK